MTTTSIEVPTTMAEDTPWGELGARIDGGQSVRQWQESAGANFKLKTAPVQYWAENGISELMDYTGQSVVYRNDTGAPMSVVSSRYRIVQPEEIFDFFGEYFSAGQMSPEVAGTMRGGGQFWALASIGEDFDVNGGDAVKPYVLLASSCDKSISTTGMLTSCRLTCMNMLQLATRNGSSIIKVPHSTTFDPETVKREMGLAREAVEQHRQTFRRLHQTRITDKQAVAFFLDLLATPEERAAGEVSVDSKRRSLPKLWDSYKGAPGAQDTLWGAVNAVTHSVDYNRHARTTDSRLSSAWFGAGAKLKAIAYERAADGQYVERLVDVTEEPRAIAAGELDDLLGRPVQTVLN